MYSAMYRRCHGSQVHCCIYISILHITILLHVQNAKLEVLNGEKSNLTLL